MKYIKVKFGLDLNPQYFCVIKTRTKGVAGLSPQEAEPEKRGGKPKALLVEGYIAPPEKPKAAGEPDIFLTPESDMGLIGQFDSDKVRRMVDLIG